MPQPLTLTDSWIETSARLYREESLVSPIKSNRDANMNRRNNDCHGQSGGWAVVNTQPHRETIALENLERQDFRAYCPVIRKRVRHARRSLDLLRPLFPGYLFAQVTLDRWRPILSTYGVRSLVRCGVRKHAFAFVFVVATVLVALCLVPALFLPRRRPARAVDPGALMGH